MPQDARTLGQKIREARLERNMTQKEVVGDFITRNMLSKIENDSATPSVKTLEYLAGVLGLSAGYFISDSAVGDEITPAAVVSARRALRENRYADCLTFLEDLDADCGGCMDEVLLLKARAASGLATEYATEGRAEQAAQYVDRALEADAAGLYHSDSFHAELLLQRARCCLETGGDGFEAAMDAFQTAFHALGLEEGARMTTAQYWLLNGELDKARSELEAVPDIAPAARPIRLLMQGRVEMLDGRFQEAVVYLLQAEQLADETGSHRFTAAVYSLLEQCYKELEDFKMAYHYAAKQLQIHGVDTPSVP